MKMAPTKAAAIKEVEESLFSAYFFRLDFHRVQTISLSLIWMPALLDWIWTELNGDGTVKWVELEEANGISLRLAAPPAWPCWLAVATLDTNSTLEWCLAPMPLPFCFGWCRIIRICNGISNIFYLKSIISFYNISGLVLLFRSCM